MTADAQLATPNGGELGVTVLVPWRDIGCAHRRAAWAWVEARWAALCPSWQLVTAEPDPGPWNYAQAANRAAAQADGDVLVLTGADIVTNLDDIVAGVHAAHRHGWAHPYAQVRRLDRVTSAELLDGDPAAPAAIPGPARPPSLGCGLLTIRRDAWHEVEGMDERFTVWGGEDNALGYALTRLVGPPARLDGRLGALWHPRDPARNRGAVWDANVALYRRYRSARTPAAMRRLIEERTP